MAARPSIPAQDGNFDERAYLVANQDVADHVALGNDAWAHFDGWGRQEGRRLAAPSHLQDILFVQTSDMFKYPAMLAVTCRTVIEFCRRNGYQYEMFIGLKRGVWSWQAVYNRIVMLKERLDQGLGGWVVYLDADAYVHDLGFNLHDFLDERNGYAAIFVEAMRGVEHWNVNAGVCLINLGHEQGRRLVELWHAAFMELSDDWLSATRIWSEGFNDQDMLQKILREDQKIAASVLIDRTDTINSTGASFIRQSLRAQFDDFGSRLAWLTQATQAVIDGDRRPVPWCGR